MNKEDKIKEVLGVCGVAIDPYEVAAFMPKKHPFEERWKMVFLMKSGQTCESDFMDETCFRSWKSKLQVLFDYIHPGKIEEWKVKKGFTGYLDFTGAKTPKLKAAEEKFGKKEEKTDREQAMKDLFKK